MEMAAGGLSIKGFSRSDDSGCSPFATLVQIDGDLCLTVRSDTPDLKSFDEDIRQHICHVRQRLSSLISTYRILVTFFRTIVGLTAGTALFKSSFEIFRNDKTIADLFSLPDWTVLGALAFFLLSFLLRAVAAVILRRLMVRRFGTVGESHQPDMKPK
jgi:hypothetical protein